jgi:hypothetical protein
MTEMEKKTTKPRQPRTATAKTTTPKLAEIKVAPAKRVAKSKATKTNASHDEIAKLAHRFWLERGRQHGYDAEDWLRAEQELIGKAS